MDCDVSDAVASTSYDVSRHVPIKPSMWPTLPDLPAEDIPSVEQVPKTSVRSSRNYEQKLRITRRWNLDKKMRVIAAPEGIRFLNATVFTLSAEEWRTWCAEWRSDTKELLLSEDRDDMCTLLRNDYGLELKRKNGLHTTKFHISKEQCKALEKRATYISNHLDVILENSTPIYVMKTVIAGKLMEIASQMNIGMSCAMSEVFDQVFQNCISLGITGEVLSAFSAEMRKRGQKCMLDHYSVYLYCMFQISDLKELLM